MSQSSAIEVLVATAVRAGEPCRGHDLLYKADYPRSIDHHIDFFGDGTPRAEAAADRCGESLLDALA